MSEEHEENPVKAGEKVAAFCIELFFTIFLIQMQTPAWVKGQTPETTYLDSPHNCQQRRQVNLGNRKTAGRVGKRREGPVHGLAWGGTSGTYLSAAAAVRRGGVQHLFPLLFVLPKKGNAQRQQEKKKRYKSPSMVVSFLEQVEPGMILANPCWRCGGWSKPGNKLRGSCFRALQGIEAALDVLQRAAQRRWSLVAAMARPKTLGWWRITSGTFCRIL